MKDKEQLQRERMTGDLGMKLLSEENMVCINCRHCEGDVLSCGLYLQKPDGVLDGGECPHFTAK